MVLACWCCLLVGGCTPRQSRDQYEERLGGALAARTEVTGQLDGKELHTAADYDAAAKKVTNALDDLESDPPPGDVENAHERMVSGMEGLAALLSRLGRCESLGEHSAQDARACRQSIGQDVYDEIRNDFGEANTIYRQEGFSLPGLGSDGDTSGGNGGGDSLGGGSDGGDEL
ncbi:MAG: hypothetical protein JWM98_2436 [Thermoleophilia bacterium]|nr:hypothetical protein [Thermoleophilia bacterium]